MGWTADVHVLPGGTDEKKIAAVPYVDTSYTDRINSFGNGSISFPSDYPRLDEILDPVTDVGSLIWFKRDGVATDMAFFAQRWSEDVADDNSRLVKITGPGIGDALLGSIIEPYGTGEALDWIWGGKNILSNPGFEDCRNIDERMELWNDAALGTFTLTVDAATTSALDFDATPNEVEVALELLGTITDCLVSGAGTETEPWQIQYVDPPYPLATMTVTDSLTGGSSTLGKTTDGAVDPTPWTKVQRVDRGVPPLIATYASNGWQLQHPDSPTALEGDYSWRVNGLAAYAGHQQLVRVTPGMTYQVKVPIWTTDGADRFRWVLRTRLEELIASSTWPDDTVSATSTWDETTWVATDVVIPDGVTEAIFRFGYVGTGNPDPYYTDYNEMNEGLGATSVGDIVDLLLTAAQAKGSLDWLEWNFTSSVDSNGTSWSQTALSFVAERGKSIGQVLGDLARFGIEFHVFWNGTAWELGLYENYDYDTYANGLGTDRSSDDSPSILLGKGVTSGPIQANSPMANVVYAEGANGLWSEAEDTASIAAWDRREGYVADFGIDDQDTLDALAQAQLEERSVVSGDKLRLNSQSHQPYDAFDLGDTLQVTLPPRADKTPRRIVGLVTKLPTASNSSPEWEVDLDQASYGPSTAVAEGLRRVLSKFNKQPDAQLFGSGIPISGSSGPIEPTYLVAAADASSEIRAVADFVCDGVDDQKEIQAAIDRIGDSSLEGGAVQLSAGEFLCGDHIELWEPVLLRGEGPEATYVSSSGDAPSTRNGLIEAAGFAQGIEDMTIGVYHDNYYATLTTSSSGRLNIVRVDCGMAVAVGEYGRVALDMGAFTSASECRIYSTDVGVYMAGSWGSLKNCDILSAGTVNGTDGSGIFISGGVAWHTSVVGNRIHTSEGYGIHALNMHDGVIANNVSATGIKIGYSSERVLVQGNHVWPDDKHAILIDGAGTGAYDNQVSNNFIHMWGTAAKSYDGIHLAGNSDRNRIFGNYLLDSGNSDLGAGGRYAINVSASTCNDTTIEANYISPGWTTDVVDSGTSTVTVLAISGAADVSPLTTKGDLWGFDTVDDRVPVGANDTILTADSAETLGVKWAAPAPQIESAFFGQSGTLTIGSGTSRLYAEAAMTIVDVSLAVGGTPSGGPCTIDVNKDGTSIFPTTAKPSVAASAYYDGGNVPDTTAVAADSYISIDFDAVNGATDAVVTLRWRKQ